MLVDSHVHLEAVDDLGGALRGARASGVGKIITIGTSIATSKKAIEIANSYSSSGLKIYATCGIHPKDGRKEVEKLSLYQCINTLKQILNRVQDDGIVVAVGECGLDYYHPAGNTRQVTSDTERKFQSELFDGQIKLAQELKLPLVIHCRNGWNETFELLSKYRLSFPRKRESSFGFRIKSGMTETGLKGVFHSFTGDWQAAKRALDLGFYISFSGIVTFKNAQEIQEVAKKMPLDRILIETDSPFLAPEPLRSIQNEPKNVKITAQFVADLRGEPFAKIAEVTTRNARRLFGI